MAKVQTMGYQQPVKIIEQKELLTVNTYDPSDTYQKLADMYQKLDEMDNIGKRIWGKIEDDSPSLIEPTINQLKAKYWQSLSQACLSTLYAIPQKKLR